MICKLSEVFFLTILLSIVLLHSILGLTSSCAININNSKSNKKKISSNQNPLKERKIEFTIWKKELRALSDRFIIIHFFSFSSFILPSLCLSLSLCFQNSNRFFTKTVKQNTHFIPNVRNSNVLSIHNETSS